LIPKTDVKNSSAISKSKVDFFESLRDFFKADTLDVDNKQRCQSCKALNNSQIRFRLKTCKKTFKPNLVLVPRILIVHMKRFDYFGSKLSNNIDFPRQFSFEKEYMGQDLQKKEESGYIE
jgi:ubiquitin C-terminal hydrolase